MPRSMVTRHAALSWAIATWAEARLDAGLPDCESAKRLVDSMARLVWETG